MAAYLSHLFLSLSNVLIDAQVGFIVEALTMRSRLGVIQIVASVFFLLFIGKHFSKRHFREKGINPSVSRLPKHFNYPPL